MNPAQIYSALTEFIKFVNFTYTVDTTPATPATAAPTTGAQNISPKSSESDVIIAPRTNPMHGSYRQPLLPTIPEVDLPSIKKGICACGSSSGCVIQ